MTFDRIYRDNAWNGVESRSGPGSGPIARDRLAASLRFLVQALRIESVLDVACGDSWWLPDLPVGYVGMDVSAEAIRLARENHPDRRFVVGDVRDGIEPADLVLFRDAMQHLPLADGVEALRAIRGSGSEWLLASTYVGGENIDIVEGGAFSPDLELPPFDLGAPTLLIPDGFSYHDRHLVRDGRKMLGLWSL